MNSIQLKRSLLSLALLSLLGSSMQAGAAEPSAGAPKAATAAAAAKPAAKPAAKASKAVKKVEVKAPVVIPLAEASAEQLEAAKRAYLGRYDCEFKQSIELEPHATAAGYVDVKYLKQVYTMKPVLSSTGALRLEDVTGRTLMIQIANKSMLLDTQVGQRIVDECLHPEQRTLIDLARAAAAAAAASGIDLSAVNGLGITPRVEKP